MKLTKASVRGLALPAGARDKIFFDDDLHGFGLRLRDGGKRTWIAQYRIGKKQRRVALGTIESTDAEEARKRAKSVLSRVHLGADPQIEKAEARAQSSATLRALIDRFLAERAAKRLKASTFTDVERYLRRHWAPLAELPARKVARADVAAQLAKLVDDSGGYAANRARATLSTLFSWAIGEGLADTNPVVGTNKPAEEVGRDRILSPVELAAVWHEAGEGDYSAIVRLLILTGQRREEVGGMLWLEIDTKPAVWAIGAGRTKNGLAHDVPLSAPAQTILSNLERREGRSLVFGAGDAGFSGWSKAKSALDKRMSDRLAKDEQSLPKADRAQRMPWRLHDIRRTVATGMADIGVQPHVIEAVLNHVSGHKAGVAGVYNRASYAAEKREALTLWGDHVAAVIEGKLP
jgi:integrase